MSRVLIIGYGNPLRRDDGFGWHVAQKLQANNVDDQVEILACHQLTPELAEPLSRAQCAIFVDATIDFAPRDLFVEKIHARDAGTVKFSHHTSPQDMLAQAQEWYGASPRDAYLISVSAEDFGFGECMSARVARLVPVVLKEIVWLCAATQPARVRKNRRAKRIAAMA